MNSHITVKMPPPFYIGMKVEGVIDLAEVLSYSMDDPPFYVHCVQAEDGSRSIQFNLEFSKSFMLNKEELYNFTNWLSWATSWVADRN